MTVKELIKEYRRIIAKDGEMTKAEIIESLNLDKELAEKSKTNETLNKIADEILHSICKTKVKNKLTINETEKHIRRMDLYNQGLNDYQIAEKEGVCAYTIWCWRDKNNLPFNPIKKENIAKRMEYYMLGYSDRAIAKMTGDAPSSVSYWRIKKGLESHNRRSMKKKEEI